MINPDNIRVVFSDGQEIIFDNPPVGFLYIISELRKMNFLSGLNPESEAALKESVDKLKDLAKEKKEDKQS